MDEKTFRSLEFHKVLDMAQAFAATAPGAAKVRALRPFADAEAARERIALVSECRGLASGGKRPGIEGFEDLAELFMRLRPEAAVLDPLEIRSFLPLLQSALNVKLLASETAFIRICALAGRLVTHAPIAARIERSIEREGRIADDASPELKNIRRSIATLRERIKLALQRLFNNRRLKPHFQDTYITERGGRSVIPVKSDARGHIPGIVHDISNTGETVFVEPYETQFMGNEIESLRAEEKLEEYRVLRALCGALRERMDEITGDYGTVVEVDAAWALSEFADALKMTPPEINAGGAIRIFGGRHPVLLKSLARAGRAENLVPLDFSLGGRDFSMVITGINTGGKTVALKTVGVLVLMSLSGMHVPAASGTTLPFVRHVLCDVGDDQSMEENLSTFSAHIVRIADILKRCTSDSLVLIDELGTGTDPDEGGALSCAVLMELKRRGALCIVTTHLGALKVFAHSTEGIVNGSMETEILRETEVLRETEILTNGLKPHAGGTLRPTYRLVPGEPGASHAFQIAARLGIPPEVIAEAAGYFKGEGGKVEELIADLRLKRREHEEKIRLTEAAKAEFERLRAALAEEIARYTKTGNEALMRAHAEAEDILRAAKRRARAADDQIRADARAAAQAARALETGIAESRAKRRALMPSNGEALKDARPGQRVRVSGLGIEGVVVSIHPKKGRAVINAGGREVEAPLDELVAVAGESGAEGGAEGGAEEKKAYRRGFGGEPSREVPFEINLIGRRVEPALSELERYLNDAALADLNSVRVIHGMGAGILSAAIREYLTGHPLARRFEKAPQEAGGDGVTIIYL